MGLSLIDRQSSHARINVGREFDALGLGLLALGIAVAINSLLGPLLFDIIDYPVSDSMRNQTIGLDAANLVVLAPMCIVVARLARRRNRWAPLLALGPTAYAAYMFVQYIAGPDHVVYMRALPLQLAAFILGWILFALAWRLRPVLDPHTPDRGPHAVVTGLLAAFVVLRYLPGLSATVAEDALPTEMQADPAMYWLIFLMDLGLFVPVAGVVMIGLWRGSTWAVPALTGLVGWYLLVTVAVGAMSITMVINDDRYASAGQVALFAAMTLALLAYTVVLARGIRSAPHAPDPSTHG